MREGAKSVRKGRFVMIIKASIAQLWKTIGTNMKDNMGQVVGANFAGSWMVQYHGSKFDFFFLVVN